VFVGRSLKCRGPEKQVCATGSSRGELLTDTLRDFSGKV
jgi:hypothetical protein